MTMHIEPEHKITAKIAKAKARYMSDAKWRKLFALLQGLPGGCDTIGLKLVGRTVTGVPLPEPEFRYRNRFSPTKELADTPFAQIEFIGISNSRVSNQEMITFFSQYGQWPIIEEDEGVLILGYAWD